MAAHLPAQERGRRAVVWRHWGFAGFCILLSVNAQKSKEAAPTAPEGVCLKGSKCSQQETSPLGFVQKGTKESKSNMMENIENEFGKASVEDMVKKTIEDEFGKASVEDTVKKTIEDEFGQASVKECVDKTGPGGSEWKEQNFYTCEFYEEYPHQCSSGAEKACCVCGGGNKDPTPEPTPVPTVPTPEPTMVCVDRRLPGNEQWYDSDGPKYNCKWYGEGDNCEDYGHSYENQNLNAKEACCVCGGGLVEVENVTIRVMSKPEMCLNAAGGRLKKYDLIQLYPCDGSAAEVFQMRTDNTIRMASNQELCLNVVGGRLERYSKIQLYTCAAREEEKFENKADGTIRVKSKPEMCLNAVGGSLEKNDLIQLYPCAVRTEEQFEVRQH